MVEADIKNWEEFAAKEANQLESRLLEMAPQDLTLRVIGQEEANGHNSLDKAFLEALEAGKHLNAKFLADF
jgi:hypothetical protein